jgi:hypothetical protein
MDDVPWYGVGPSDPTPVPILGPDIIDPRQMDMIRRLAEQKAEGEHVVAARSLPAWGGAGPALADKPKPAAKAAAPAAKAAAPAPAAEMSPEEKRRAEALARKAARAAKGGAGEAVAEAPAAAAPPAAVAAPAAPVKADLPDGGKPWEEAEDIREQRKAAALARKAARAAKRGEG